MSAGVVGESVAAKCGRDLVASDLARLNELCQERGIGKAGDSVIDSLIRFVELHSAPVNPEPPQVAIIWHKTPELAYRAYWEPVAIEEGTTYDELIADAVLTGLDKDGKEVTTTAYQDIEGIRRMGYWGWVDTENRTIHAWASNLADAGGILHMLAHEIGHITGIEHPDGLQEEFRAEQFGRVARQAYALLKQRPVMR